jgi:hypothetical protein
LLKPSLSAAHSSAITPTRTSSPAFRKSSMPRPAWRGFTSIAPITIVFMPAWMSSLVHAAVRPNVEHGSSVT